MEAKQSRAWNTQAFVISHWMLDCRTQAEALQMQGDGAVLKVEPTRFPMGLDMGCGLSSRKDGARHRLWQGVGPSRGMGGGGWDHSWCQLSSHVEMLSG